MAEGWRLISSALVVAVALATCFFPFPANASVAKYLNGTTQERLKLLVQSRQACATRVHADNQGAARRAPRERPYISFILTTRNENEQGQHFRLSHHLKNIATGLAKHGSLDFMEVIIVDYNSNPDIPPLLEAATITWPSLLQLPLIRVITVPKAIHEEINNYLGNLEDPGYWEYFAKNIALRRACGNWLLVTNPDVVFSSAFFEWLVTKPLNPQFYYRLGRYNAEDHLPEDSLSWSMEQVLSHLQKRVSAVCGPSWVSKEAWDAVREMEALNRPLDFSLNLSWGNVPVFGCPGDFTLMHWKSWYHMRGYPQVPCPVALDDVAVEAAVAMGLEAAVPAPPIALFHIPHSKSYNPRVQVAWTNALAVLNVTLADGRAEMQKEKHMVFWNDLGWGMAYHHLREDYL